MKRGERAQRGFGTKTKASVEELVQLARLRVAGGDYALNIMGIKEISRLPEITRIPRAPDFLEGFINLRGLVVPLINVTRRLGLGEGQLGPKSRVVIVTVGRQIVGLAVDEIRGVLRIPRAEILSSPRVLRGEVPDYLGGVVRQSGDLILLLDLEKILTMEEIKGIEKMVPSLGRKK